MQREIYQYMHVIGCPYGCCGPLRPKTFIRSNMLSRHAAKSRAKSTRIEHRLVRRLRKKEIQNELNELIRDWFLDEIEFIKALKDIGFEI